MSITTFIEIAFTGYNQEFLNPNSC